jgi:hypothetical protein
MFDRRRLVFSTGGIARGASVFNINSIGTTEVGRVKSDKYQPKKFYSGCLEILVL